MATTKSDSEAPQNEICGIVMPISAIDGCTEEHWRDVRRILDESIQDAGFTPQLVSEADDVGVIHKRIIQNLYSNPIAVCDISGKNPNVMFELGIRLAFDKPTIIIKDEKTSYPFDTASIEHLTYPRDLRFAKIVEFQDLLAEKIKATHHRAAKDKDYTTFLKHFGTFKIADLKTEVVAPDQILLEEMRALRQLVLSLHTSTRAPEPDAASDDSLLMCARKGTKLQLAALLTELRSMGISPRRSLSSPPEHAHFRFPSLPLDEQAKVLEVAKKHVPDTRWLSPRAPRRTDA